LGTKGGGAKASRKKAMKRVTRLATEKGALKGTHSQKTVEG